MDTDDAMLIERSVRGRPDAFVEVVRRHEAAVHAFLARRAGRTGGLATALGTRNALWIVLAGYAASGAFLLTPTMLSNRELPGSIPAMSQCAAAQRGPGDRGGDPRFRAAQPR